MKRGSGLLVTMGLVVAFLSAGSNSSAYRVNFSENASAFREDLKVSVCTPTLLTAWTAMYKVSMLGSSSGPKR